MVSNCKRPFLHKTNKGKCMLFVSREFLQIVECRLQIDRFDFSPNDFLHLRRRESSASLGVLLGVLSRSLALERSGSH
jgi:hypothetical protein